MAVGSPVSTEISDEYDTHESLYKVFELCTPKEIITVNRRNAINKINMKIIVNFKNIICK